MAVRTWAPRGQTPVLRVKLTRDHLSAISGITPDGRLVMPVQDHAYGSEDVVRRLSPAAPQAQRQAARDLGWLADSSRPGGQSVLEAKSGQASAAGPPA